MSKEAMKLALEALEDANKFIIEVEGDDAYRHAITALEEALAEQEQRSDSEQLGEPDLIECGNCHEGLSDMEHVCKKCLGAGWVNNPKQEQGEPVAYMWPTKDSFVSAEDVGLIPNWTDYYTVPLYTTPQQRTWVGLTTGETAIIVKMLEKGNLFLAIAATEAKLKEKNT